LSHLERIGSTFVDIGVLANPGSWYFEDIARAALKRGHRCQRLDFTRLTSLIPSKGQGSVISSGDTTISRMDAVIVRTMPPGSLEQVVFRMDVLTRLAAGGVEVLNPPKAIECAVDKYLTTARLSAEGLPVPATIVCESADAALEAFGELGGDVVVKPIFGAEGRGILRVSDPDLALRTFRTLERIQSVLYLQRFVEHDGSDIRVLVLDGRVLGAMRRRSDDDYRVNISRNGRAEPHHATEQERELALRAATATGTRFGGIDILYDRDGLANVIEINAVPGWRAFSRVTGIDVAAELIDSLSPRG